MNFFQIIKEKENEKEKERETSFDNAKGNKQGEDELQSGHICFCNLLDEMPVAVGWRRRRSPFIHSLQGEMQKRLISLKRKSFNIYDDAPCICFSKLAINCAA